MNAQEIVALGFALGKALAIEFGLDEATVLRSVAIKLPALMPSPADELTDYEAARKVAESTR